MIVNKMAKAENMRYAKIQRLIHLLCQEDKTILDDIMEDSVNQSFHVGRKIMVNDRTITVKNKTYMPSESKVTINTEGSMAIYDHSGLYLLSD